MSVRMRLAVAFALVALGTGAAVAVATPALVDRGFERLAAEGGEPGGPGHGPGPGTRPFARQVEQETTLTIIAVALAAAAAASAVGAYVAGRIARPLTQLERAAAAVADGDFSRRSGLAGRTDELGSLGRSFDRMAESLAGTETARRRFFQDVVHELKTPLTVIEATATAVLDGVYGHDDRHLVTVRDQARVLARTVDDLRTLSLAGEDALELRVEAVPVEEALARSATAFRARADLAGVVLRVDAPPGIAVRADPGRLAQVLGALLDNAIRHTPRDGAVTVSAEGDAGEVRIDVCDTGAGLGPAEGERVFDRYYSTADGRDVASARSGLGLAIVAALVHAHGGSVGVGVAPGGGARFWVRLPAIAVPSEEPVPPAS
jgi:two-component system sensor histidine kinase BaeS